eukprot:8559436-Pyramimonas_sp.AAC.1
MPRAGHRRVFAEEASAARGIDAFLHEKHQLPEWGADADQLCNALTALTALRISLTASIEGPVPEGASDGDIASRQQ